MAARSSDHKQRLEQRLSAAQKRLAKLRQDDKADRGALRLAHKRVKRSQRALKRLEQPVAESKPS